MLFLAIFSSHEKIQAVIFQTIKETEALVFDFQLKVHRAKFVSQILPKSLVWSI